MKISSAIIISMTLSQLLYASPAKEEVCEANPEDKAIKTLSEDVTDTTEKMKDDAIERGRKLVQSDGKGRCLECHAYGDDNAGFAFLPNDNVKDETFKEGQTYLKQVLAGSFKEIINESVVKSKKMPPGGDDLSDRDREDIQAYIESFSK